MGKTGRKFDIQFKSQICQPIEAGTHTVLDICRDHQLQLPVVEGWMSRYGSRALATKSPNRESELARENEKLKAKIGALTMTIDFLKKWRIGNGIKKTSMSPHTRSPRGPSIEDSDHCEREGLGGFFRPTQAEDSLNARARASYFCCLSDKPERSSNNDKSSHRPFSNALKFELPFCS